MEIYISLIIPAYNESKRIRRALEPAVEYLKKQEFTSEIIVVDDGSTDDTSNIVNNYINISNNIKLVKYNHNKGKGYAVKTGMLKAVGKYRFFMDADYAVPIEYLESMLHEIKENDIVIGSRGLQDSYTEIHQNFIREKLAILFGKLQRVILSLPIHDTQCGFKLFTDKAAKILFNLITFDCSYFDTELLYIAYKRKMKIKEIPVRWKHDHETRLPVGFKRTLDLLIKLFKIRSLHKLK